MGLSFGMKQYLEHIYILTLSHVTSVYKKTTFMHIFPTTLSDHFNTFISFAPSITEFPSVMLHISFLAAVLFTVKSVQLLSSEHVGIKSTVLRMSAIHAVEQTILCERDD
jgi:hypothetical protein